MPLRLGCGSWKSQPMRTILGTSKAPPSLQRAIQFRCCHRAKCFYGHHVFCLFVSTQYFGTSPILEIEKKTRKHCKIK